MTIHTKEPVTLGGWYEHEDGTVGDYQWSQGQAQLVRTVASWAEVPSRAQDLQDAIRAGAI
jgi:hypothetical protein